MKRKNPNDGNAKSASFFSEEEEGNHVFSSSFWKILRCHYALIVIVGHHKSSSKGNTVRLHFFVHIGHASY